MKTYISTFTYKGEDVDVLYAKGQLSYVFEYKGKRYGGAVKAVGRSVQNIMAATACLIISYVEQREAVEKND